jgi:5-formyltetrahydrofolate cyclo-ligase
MADPLPKPSPSAPKAAWRAWARSLLKTGSSEQLQAASAAISGHLGGLLAGIRPRERQDILLGYIPIRSEIDPIVALSAAIASGWRLGVGRGVSSSAPLQPVTVGAAVLSGNRWDLGACEPDAWGVPVPRDHAPVPAAAVRVALVPGLAFDRRGHRLGRGAGVYDRFLATLPASAWRIGIVPSARLVDALPAEAHDIAMHAIVTEDGCLRVAEPAA